MNYTIYTSPKFLIIPDGTDIVAYNVQGVQPAAKNYPATKEEIIYGTGFANGAIIINTTKRNADLTARKSNLKKSLDVILQTKRNSYKGSVAYNSDTWNSSLASLENVQIELADLAANPNLTPDPWRNYSNQMINLTKNQLIALMAAINADLRITGKSLYETLWTKKDEIDAINTIANAEIYDVNSGWLF